MDNPTDNQVSRSKHAIIAIMVPFSSLCLSLLALWDRGDLLSLSWVLASLSWMTIEMSRYWVAKRRTSQFLGYASILSVVIAIILFLVAYLVNR